MAFLKRHGVLIALLALAAGLRFFRIDAQSLWYDEGNSARIAERSISLILAGAAGDIHPPLYYLLLSLWRALFGASEAALRALSAACGVATVWISYLCLAHAGYRRAGAIAAFFGAIAPFAVYYSQEARMYAALALCATTSTFGLVDLFFRGHARGALIYGVATALGLWTQYAYPFVMLAQGAWALLLLFSAGRAYGFASQRAPLAHYALANAAAIAAFAPWLPIALRQIRSWSVEAQPYELGAAALDAYRWLVVGRTLTLSDAAVPLSMTTLLVLLGLLLHHSSWRFRLGWLLLAALPLALLFVFNLYRDAYLKFLLVCVAPLLTLAALGADTLSERLAARLPKQMRLVPAALVAALLAGSLRPSLNNLYFNPAFARDDYRGIYRQVAAMGDAAVLFNAPNQWEVYTYYQRNDANLFPLRYRPETQGLAAQQLERIAFGQPRLFVLYFAERDADPNGWYERWLAENIAKVHESWIGNIRLALYSGANTYTRVAQDVTFGDAITLVNAEADLTRGDGVVPLRLTWRTRKALDKRYKVFVHVGAADTPPVAQADSEPVAGYRPSDGWQVGETIRDERGVWLQPGTSAGIWGVYVGLYDSATGERLGDRIKLGNVTVK
jgi:4-amino-4-deoxy-L-arabinose transferase-like glycosyltransferase